MIQIAITGFTTINKILIITIKLMELKVIEMLQEEDILIQKIWMAQDSLIKQTIILLKHFL